MTNNTYYFYLSLAFCFILFVLMMVLYGRYSYDREKSSSYECGFDPKLSARLPFSLRFFLLAVIFMVFDIEVVFLLPIPLSFFSGNYIALNFSFMFLIILLMGLMHEWREGSLNWVME